MVSRAFYTDQLGPFVAGACKLMGMDMGLPMNTGAEAVETALKAARKWAYTVKGISENEAEIIVCEGNFHGRTIAIIGFSSEDQYRRGFGPFPKGFIRIPYGDTQTLEQAITPNTAAFLVEPVQGEGGIIAPPWDISVAVPRYAARSMCCSYVMKYKPDSDAQAGYWLVIMMMSNLMA